MKWEILFKIKINPFFIIDMKHLNFCMVTVLNLLVTLRIVQAGLFDSFIVQRVGTSMANTDSARIGSQAEPDSPNSVEDVHTYIGAMYGEDQVISVVSCFSMRNGLYGKPTEAIVYWNSIDFSEPDKLRYGHVSRDQTV